MSRLQELPEALRTKAIEGLRGLMSPEERASFREHIAKHGEKWYTQGLFHFRGGMLVRNDLRSKVGILDGELPSNNWDDYYIEVIEEAIKELEV